MAKHVWKSELGKQIREARERRGISQEALAKRVRSGRASIISYENGSGNPRFRVIAEIAAELKADFDVLGCRVVAGQLLAPKTKDDDQLELKYDQDHSFLANVTIRPAKKSITITAHSEYGIKSA